MMSRLRSNAYISGPMTGMPEHGFPAFRECAETLRRWTDWCIISPVELEMNKYFPVGSLSWDEYLRADLRELLDCNVIVRLPGWENSRGAKLEIYVATSLGCQVYDYHPDMPRAEGLVRATDDEYHAQVSEVSQ